MLGGGERAKKQIRDGISATYAPPPQCNPHRHGGTSRAACPSCTGTTPCPLTSRLGADCARPRDHVWGMGVKISVRTFQIVRGTVVDKLNIAAPREGKIYLVPPHPLLHIGASLARGVGQRHPGFPRDGPRAGTRRCRHGRRRSRRQRRRRHAVERLRNFPRVGRVEAERVPPPRRQHARLIPQRLELAPVLEGAAVTQDIRSPAHPSKGGEAGPCITARATSSPAGIHTKRLVMMMVPMTLSMMYWRRRLKLRPVNCSRRLVPPSLALASHTAAAEHAPSEQAWRPVLIARHQHHFPRARAPSPSCAADWPPRVRRDPCPGNRGRSRRQGWRWRACTRRGTGVCRRACPRRRCCSDTAPTRR